MNLELNGFFRFLPFIVLPFFLIAGSIGTIKAFNDNFLFSKIFMVIWMGGVIYQIPKFLKMVIQIHLMDNKIRFKTILGKEYELFAEDFVSIQVKSNLIDFKVTNGSFNSIGNFDGFSEFIVALKKNNPSLVTKGC